MPSIFGNEGGGSTLWTEPGTVLWYKEITGSLSPLEIGIQVFFPEA